MGGRIAPGEFRKGRIVKAADGELFRVEEVPSDGETILLSDAKGQNRMFSLKSPFRAASDAEKKRFWNQRARCPGAHHRERSSRVLRLESGGYRDRLENFFHNMSTEDPARAVVFREFWNQLTQIFGDDPPDSWRIKEGLGGGAPVICVRSPLTGRPVSLAYFFFLVGRKQKTPPHIVVVKRFCKKEHEGLFSKANDYYGQGHGVSFERGPTRGQLRPYLECLREIHNDLSPKR